MKKVTFQHIDDLLIARIKDNVVFQNKDLHRCANRILKETHPEKLVIVPGKGFSLTSDSRRVLTLLASWAGSIAVVSTRKDIFAACKNLRYMDKRINHFSQYDDIFDSAKWLSQ